MVDKVLSKEKKTTGFWPQLETVSDQVVCLSLFMSVSHKRFQDTGRKDLSFSEEEHLVPGDHWIHRDLTPVVKTVSIFDTDSGNHFPYFCNVLIILGFTWRSSGQSVGEK